jgi:Fic family protein
MPDWDQDSPQLRKNLREVLDEIAAGAARREPLTVGLAKNWHSRLMQNLAAPDSRWVGAFRGEPGLEDLQVRVRHQFGVDAIRVGEELAEFQTKLSAIIGELDAMLPAGKEPDADQLAAVIDVCAWVHAEWVRIHPFANGNGRVARLWANCIAMRYALPAFVRLRPRPDYGYGDAGARAMQGDWKPTASVFRRLLDAFLNEV